MSFIRFLQNSDVRALNLVFLVPWWLTWSFDKMFHLVGVSGLLEADHLWPITLPKGPLGLNQWWKPLYCCGTTIKNVFTFLNNYASVYFHHSTVHQFFFLYLSCYSFPITFNKTNCLPTCFPVHVGPDKTEIHAKRGFRFVDPYEKKTILNLNGSVWHIKPESVKASTVTGDSLVTHRVRSVVRFLVIIILVYSL